MADMNITPARSGLVPQIWNDKYFSEYVRQNRFKRYFGTTETSMIQLREDLTTKKGNAITFAAARRLQGAGVTGNQLLEGNEELLDTRSMKLTVSPVRHAVAASDWDEQQSILDLLGAARPALKVWSMEKMRNDIINGLSQVSVDNSGNPVYFGAATATQKNVWLVANSDRVLFGSNLSNNTGTLSTSLANVTVSNGTMTGSLLSKAKRLAQTASPHIRPIQVNDESDEEWFVAFMPSLVFRDFRSDPAVLAVNKDARPRERGWEDNPLFAGGDLMWDGMIVREIPELPFLSGAGGSGINLAASYICGAQALGIAWAQRTKATTNTRDYGFVHGVGIQEIRGIGKLMFGRDPTSDVGSLTDNGLFTVFTAASADT